MNARGWFLICTTALLAAVSVRAVDAVTDEGERQRIAVERQQADADFSRRDQACRSRFVVAACQEEARKEHRDANERLRLQLSMLDESQRKRRAAERIDAIRAKVSAEEAMRRDVEMQERGRPQVRPVAAAAESRAGFTAATPKPVRVPVPPKVRAAKPGADVRAATEARKRSAESASRRVAAQAHREAVERRNALRTASGKKVAAPLPLPASATPP